MLCHFSCCSRLSSHSRHSLEWGILTVVSGRAMFVPMRFCLCCCRCDHSAMLLLVLIVFQEESSSSSTTQRPFSTQNMNSSKTSPVDVEQETEVAALGGSGEQTWFPIETPNWPFGNRKSVISSDANWIIRNLPAMRRNAVPIPIRTLTLSKDPLLMMVASSYDKYIVRFYFFGSSVSSFVWKKLL